MASHTPQQDSAETAGATQSDADISTIDILRKLYNSSVLASTLTREQIPIVLIFLFLFFIVYYHWNIKKSFWVVLYIIIIVVLLKALCLLYDYVKAKLKLSAKSEDRDLEKQTSTSKSITEDRKDAQGAQETGHDDDLLLGVRGASDYTPPKAVRETRARGEKKAKDDREDVTGAQEPEHDDDLVPEGPTEPFATRTAYRSIGPAASGQKKDVRKYFYYIKERTIRSFHWMDLAFCLGFTYRDIVNIEARNRDGKSRCMDMLEAWVNRHGPEATIERLMEALSEIGLRSVVDGLGATYPELAAQHETSV